MKRSIERIRSGYEKAKEAKTKWISLYRPVFDYVMPHRLTTSDKKGVNLFSSLGEATADNFVRKVQDMLTPVGQDWINLEAGYLIKKKTEDVSEINKELEKVAEIMNVFKDTSNFDVTATEFYYDLIVGTACFLISEGTQDNPIRCTAIPVDQYAFEEGAFGEVSAVYRDVSVRRELVNVTWRDAKYSVPKEKAEQEVKLIETTYFDYDENVWHYVVIDEESKKSIVERIYKSNPFIILRWTKFSGEIYGRGQGMKVIHDLQTHNKIKEYSLRALAFTIPVFLASQEGDYDVEDFVFEPGAINPVPSTATNNPTITQLGVNQSPDIQSYNMEQLEMDIKKNMYDTTIPNDPNRDITATEIAERASDLAGNIINSFGRIKNEFMYPIIKRMAEVLQRFGYIQDDIDVRAFNGFGYQIKINTMLSNQQKQSETQAISNALQFITSFDPNMQLTPKVLDIVPLAIYMLERLGMPNKFVNSKDIVEQKFAEEGEAAAAASQANANQEVAVSNEIEKGKANAKRFTA